MQPITGDGMDEIASNEHAVFQGIEIGVGAWAWGDRIFWGFKQDYAEKDIFDAFQASIETGMVFFDTAEVYGQGQSEKYLGKFLKSTGVRTVVATKFMPFPWRLTGNALRKALKSSLQRLDLPRLDLYQVHMPFPPVKIETWMGAMAEACQAGLTGAIGVSNYDQAQTRRAFEALQHEGLRLASNQVEYHLLNRKIEQNGLLQHCQEMGVKVISYSPLAQGVLTGKYSAENPMRGFRGRKYNRKYLDQVKPLLQLMKKIGLDHDGKTIGQVALNWTICKGTLPIPGAKNAEQVRQNSGALGWRLSPAEISLLDDTSTLVLKDL
jgi:aryl-alcohol dehydrogenase-like predicted oxidoreductase